MMKFRQTSILFKLVSAFSAFVLWGGWAFYINGGFGFKARVVSGLAQGLASFLITLFMIRVVTWIFCLLPDNFFQYLLPGLITVSFTGTCLFFMHYRLGTPNIVYTIAPALSVAFIFCVFTAFKLKGTKK